RLRLQHQIAAGVVVMVMRVENMRQPPALALELAEDWLDLRRVDGRGDARLLVVDEEGVIVRQTREHVHFDSAHFTASSAHPTAFDPRRRSPPRRHSVSAYRTMSHFRVGTTAAGTA